MADLKNMMTKASRLLYLTSKTPKSKTLGVMMDIKKNVNKNLHERNKFLENFENYMDYKENMLCMAHPELLIEDYQSYQYFNLR